MTAVATNLDTGDSSELAVGWGFCSVRLPHLSKPDALARGSAELFAMAEEPRQIRRLHYCAR